MNKDMRKFLVRLILLFAGVAGCFVLMVLFGRYIIGNQYQQMFGGVLVDKVARIKAINEPKIVIGGNSNVAFGINSPMIQEAMNMPVVNLGLHSDLGTIFLENLAGSNIHSGDILIICPTSFSGDGNINDVVSVWQTIEYHIEFLRLLSPKDYFMMAAAYPIYWVNTFGRWLTHRGSSQGSTTMGKYSSFNEYGDIVIKPDSERISAGEIRDAKINVPDIDETFITRINDLNAYINSKGATLLIAGYPITLGEQTPSAEEYEVFNKNLAQSLDCEVISDYRDYLIPYQYFYDGTLHVDNEGAKIRTAQLIKDLKNWQANR